MNFTGKWTLPVVLICLLVVGLMLTLERNAHLKTKAECDKKDALIKAADESAAAIAASLDFERQARANLAADYEKLEDKYNKVRKPKKANAFSNLPDAVRADSLRNSIIRAVQQ